MEIIPAIDIIEGKCVRLTKGDFSQKKIYNEDPVEVAMEFEDAGLKRLHLVDLDGARLGNVRNWKVLENIASRTKLIIDFGGGVKSEDDVKILFNSGAALATVGSIAVKEPEEFLRWLKSFGPNKFLLAADVKDEKIVVKGWTETTDLDIYDFIAQQIENGITQVFCTDVSKDGLLEGPAIELYKTIHEKFQDLYLVASGGVSNREDLYQLNEVGCGGVIIGKAFYEGRITLEEVMEFIL